MKTEEPNLDGFIEQLQRCRTLGELSAYFHESFAQLGFPISIYMRFHLPSYETLSSDIFSNQFVVGTTFPDEWQVRYRQQGYHQIDPVIRQCKTAMAPALWRDVLETKKLDATEQQLFSEAHDFGLLDGVAIPLHGPGGRFAVVSASSGGPPSEFDEQVLAHKHRLHLMALHFQAAIEALLAHGQSDAPQSELTPRETECLKWTARGKSSWEISTILSLSERTVNFHLSNAMRKLDVSNRTHAVAKSIYQGLIQI